MQIKYDLAHKILSDKLTFSLSNANWRRHTSLSFKSIFVFVHLKGLRFIWGPHPVIISSSGAVADLMTKIRAANGSYTIKTTIITIITHFVSLFQFNVLHCKKQLF